MKSLRHTRAVSTWRLGITWHTDLARDARHAKIEGTRNGSISAVETLAPDISVVMTLPVCLNKHEFVARRTLYPKIHRGL